MGDHVLHLYSQLLTDYIIRPITTIDIYFLC